jgi:hypothetical protein
MTHSWVPLDSTSQNYSLVGELDRELMEKKKKIESDSKELAEKKKIIRMQEGEKDIHQSHSTLLFRVSEESNP